MSRERLERCVAGISEKGRERDGWPPTSNNCLFPDLAKPYKDKSKEVKEAQRFVSKQPVRFDNKDYNLRKLNELPYHLVEARKLDFLKKDVICNYEFLLAKISAVGIRYVWFWYQLIRIQNFYIHNSEGIIMKIIFYHETPQFVLMFRTSFWLFLLIMVQIIKTPLFCGSTLSYNTSKLYFWYLFLIPIFNINRIWYIFNIFYLICKYVWK